MDHRKNAPPASGGGRRPAVDDGNTGVVTRRGRDRPVSSGRDRGPAGLARRVIDPLAPLVSAENSSIAVDDATTVPGMSTTLTQRALRPDDAAANSVIYAVIESAEPPWAPIG